MDEREMLELILLRQEREEYMKGLDAINSRFAADGSQNIVAYKQNLEYLFMDFPNISEMTAREAELSQKFREQYAPEQPPTEE